MYGELLFLERKGKALIFLVNFREFLDCSEATFDNYFSLKNL